MCKVTDPQFNLNNIQDLIDLTRKQEHKDNKDIQRLKKITGSLRKLQNMVGMDDLKKQIMYQILFYVQDLNSDEMMHTALMGPPGVGKTTVAKIIAKIYKDLGFLSRGKLIIAGREDLVGQYLGQTAIKTRHVLEQSIGNVLFIDEAYALGNNNDRDDSYAKECVDTLTAFLSEHTKNFICIVAGYEKELMTCFFGSNIGLDRRFPWKYILKSYNNEELSEIFLRKLEERRWKLRIGRKQQCLDKLKAITKEHQGYFENNGGDMQNFINACMLAHSKRVFGTQRSFKKHLVETDIEKGFAIYKNNKKTPTTTSAPPVHMYL